MRKQLEDRIEEIKKGIEQSAANYNALLGRLAEATHLLSELPEDGVEEVQPAVGE